MVQAAVGPIPAIKTSRDWMTPDQRLNATIAFQPVDRVVVGPFVFGYAVLRRMVAGDWPREDFVIADPGEVVTLEQFFDGWKQS